MAMHALELVWSIRKKAYELLFFIYQILVGGPSKVIPSGLKTKYFLLVTQFFSNCPSAWGLGAYLNPKVKYGVRAENDCIYIYIIHLGSSGPLCDKGNKKEMMISHAIPSIKK
jgi:hypothetical protein